MASDVPLTSRSSEMGFPRRAISAFTFFYLYDVDDRWMYRKFRWWGGQQLLTTENRQSRRQLAVLCPAASLCPTDQSATSTYLYVKYAITSVRNSFTVKDSYGWFWATGLFPHTVWLSGVYNRPTIHYSAIKALSLICIAQSILESNLRRMEWSLARHLTCDVVGSRSRFRFACRRLHVALKLWANCCHIYCF